MPLSISSSSFRRIPSGPYGRMWLFAIFFVLVFLFFAEFAMRKSGFLPSVSDSKILWCMKRSGVYADKGKRNIVIAGSSRAQLGIDPRILEDELCGCSVSNLAIDGTPAFELVRDLCLDPDFKGVIIFSTTVQDLYPADEDSGRRDMEYVSYFNEGFHSGAAIEKRFNTFISSFLQSKLALLSSNRSLKFLIRKAFKIGPSYWTMRFDRYRPARYRKVMNEDQLKAHKIWRLKKEEAQRRDVSHEDFVRILNKLSGLYKMLKARGGEMVIVRMPTTNELWEMDEKRTPKRLYWDMINERTGIPVIHFRDVPGLSGFECPETSHLDASDAPKFTRKLADILREKL